MHQDFLARFSMYQMNHPFIIQLYSQLHKGSRNEWGCKFSLPTKKRKENACSTEEMHKEQVNQWTPFKVQLLHVLKTFR